MIKSKIDDNNVKLEAQFKTQISTQKEHQTLLKGHRATLDVQERKLGSLNTILEQHTTTLEDYGIELEDHRSSLDVQEMVLEGHGTTIELQQAALADHGTTLEDHSDVLHHHTDQIAHLQQLQPQISCEVSEKGMC